MRATDQQMTLHLAVFQKPVAEVAFTVTLVVLPPGIDVGAAVTTASSATYAASSSTRGLGNAHDDTRVGCGMAHLGVQALTIMVKENVEALSADVTL